MILFFSILFCWNVFVFTLFGLDKWKARRRKWRISEQVLLTTAFCFGSLGAATGMSLFRHKTKNKKFMIFIPIALLFHLSLLTYILLQKIAHI